MLLSPDSPQFSLGETNEENSTKPHVQPTLLPPSPTLYHFFFFFFFPASLLALLEERGASHSSTPPPFVALSSPLLSHTLLSPHLSQALLLFSPPLSLLCFTSLFGPQSKFLEDGSMAAEELTNSSSVAE